MKDYIADQNEGCRLRKGSTQLNARYITQIQDRK